MKKYLKIIAIFVLAGVGVFVFQKITQIIAAGNAPVVYWKMDEGTGTTLNTSSGTASATLNSPVNLPTWQTEDLCVSGKCLYFEGSNATASAQAINILGTQTVSFWVKPASSSGTIPFISFSNGTGTQAITSSNLTLSAPGLTSPAYYVNGVATTTLTANNWNHVVVTASGFNATNPVLGKVHNVFFKGFIDDVKFYDYARSATQVLLDYNAKSAAASKGAGAKLGAQTMDALNQGLVGYWKMDETSGNAADSSGNSLTLTNNHSTAYGAGKFGNSMTCDGANDYLNTGTTISGIKTVSFWVYPAAAANNYFINLINSSAYITINSSGVVSATGFTSPSIYVNGALNGTVTAATWSIITIASETAINANAFAVGLTNDGSNHFCTSTSRIDDVRLYNRALSSAEVSQLYNFAPGPVAYWKMEEGSGTTTNDSSGNSNTSSAFTGNVAWTTGRYGKGLSFDGNNSVVRIVESSSTDLGATTDSYTVSAWMKTTTNFSASAIIVAKQTAGTFPFTLNLTSSEYAYFALRDGSNNPSCTGSTALNDGQWHFITGVRDVLADTVSLYVDGKFITRSTDTTTATSVNNDDISIGNGNNSSYNASDFTGQIDDVRIYNYARTPGQIVQDMNAGHPLVGSPVGSSVGYWKFDELTGTTANNSGSGGSTYNGTLEGMSSPPSVGVSGWLTAGKYGGALAFDGSNDDVTLGDLTFAETASQLSWSFWVNPNSVVATKCLFCKYNNAATQHSWAIETGTTNASAVRVTVPTTTTEADNTTYGETPTGKLAVGIWSHVLAVFDGTQTGNANRLKIYINGINQTLTFAGTIPASLLATTSNAILGESSDGSRNFSGQMDEVKIYSGALSPSEVLTDYNRASSIVLGVLGTNTSDGKTASASAATAYCIPGDTTSCAPPVAEWKFEEGTGGNANDISGNGYTGTATGTTVVTGKFGKARKFSTLTRNTFPTTDVIDNFNRANEGPPLSSSWTSMYNGLKVSSNTAIANVNDYCTEGYNASTYGADSEAYITLTTLPGNYNEVYVMARMTTLVSATSDYYSVGFTQLPGTDNVTIYRVTNDTPTQLGAIISQEFSAGDGLGIEVIGSTIKAYRRSNGVWSDISSGGRTDTTYPNAGYLGLVVQGTTAVADDFGGGTVNVVNGDNIAATITDPGYANTVEAWVYPTSSVASKTIITTSRLTTDSSSRPVYGGCTGTALSLNQWTHIAATSTDSTHCAIYQNGVLTSSGSTGVTFGTAVNIGYGSFTGNIDEVKIYNYARTPAQIAWDYNNGKPVAHYKFDECQGSSANDSSGNGQTGTITIGGSGTQTAVGTCTTSGAWYNGVSGKYNYSLNLDGSDDYITTAAFSPLAAAAQTTTKASWGGWYYPTTSVTSKTLVEKATEFRLMTDSSGKPTCGVYSGNFTANSAATASAALSTSAWSHLLCTYDGTNIKLYQNGVNTATNAFSGNITAASSILYMGESSGGAQFYNGQLDEQKIWNYPLTAAQVKMVYNQGSAIRFGPLTGSP